MCSLKLTSMASRILTGNTHRYKIAAGYWTKRSHNSNWNTSFVDFCRPASASLPLNGYETLSNTDARRYSHTLSRTDGRGLYRNQNFANFGTVNLCNQLESGWLTSNIFRDFRGNDAVARRYLHTSHLRHRDESKVEETLEAIKDTIKKAEPPKPSGVPESPAVGATDALTPAGPATVAVPVKKKPLSERIIAELKHYYHGFRLLFIDVRVCARLIWRVLNGKTLMRREQKQLVRTTADMFRLVPFLVFIIVPFAEFLLPVALKLFPGMLPSTFQEEDKEKEKIRKTLKMKLEMAKFLQDTIEETALQREGASGESAQEFVGFMEKIRTSGVQTSNEEILKFSKLFEDEITLDNLSYQQLSALCKLVEVTSVGPSYFLRFQLEMKMRQLEADDKMIQKEGVDSMAVWELQEACRQRGMRSFGVPEIRLRSQLSQWLDLHLNHKIPTSLLLLSRTLYLPEHLTTEDQLKATISALPDAMTEEAKVKISEVSGDRVDNKSKLELIKQEEEMIQQEKAELQRLRKEEEAKKAKAMEAKAKAEKLAEEQAAVSQAPSEFVDSELPLKQVMVDKATVLEPQAHEKEEIDTKDLEEIETLLEHVAGKKMELKKEFEELEALKEDFSEYKENLGELKGVMEQTGGTMAGLQEAKSAQRLGRTVSRMIEQMDDAVKGLAAQKAALLDDIKAKEGRVRDAPELGKDDTTRKQILEQISEEKDSLITVTDLLNSIQSLQKIPDSAKFEKIAKFLDADKDGAIDLSDAMKVIDLLGKESVKLNAEQLAEIMALLKKEKVVDDEEKKMKKLQQQQQQQQQAASAKQPADEVKQL